MTVDNHSCEHRPDGKPVVARVYGEYLDMLVCEGCYQEAKALDPTHKYLRWELLSDEHQTDRH